MAYLDRDSMFDRGVRRVENSDKADAQVAELPLNLIAIIISYLDQPADLARVCRTSRVLHYMTLPQLYSSVSLRSYDYIRYSSFTGRPEGFGGASPFSMGLNGLVTRNVASYVKKFKVFGEWKDYELGECAKVGRVPDGSMMMSCLVRIAIERMAVLDSFSWELNSKMLPTVWQGLAQTATLKSLTIKMPAVRLPRPTLTAPPIPNLQYLKVIDIDPLCYPDDISLLLLESKRLRDLRLHWSPRMRKALEPSVNLSTFFGKIRASKRTLPLVSIAFQNLYAHSDGGFEGIIDVNKLQEFTFINCFGGECDIGDSVFIDSSWNIHSRDKDKPKLKTLRLDKVTKGQIELLGSLTGLESYYLIGAREPVEKQPNGSEGNYSHTPADAATPYSASSTPSDTAYASMGRDYLNAICLNHGSTLRHLLLMPDWRLCSEELARLVRSCPKLTQLGVGLDFPDFTMLRLLIPFLPQLTALRILKHPVHDTFSEELAKCPLEYHEQHMGMDLSQWDSNLKWIGVGDLIFEVKKTSFPEEMTENGERARRWDVKAVSLEDVDDVDIWRMDRMQI